MHTIKKSKKMTMNENEKMSSCVRWWIAALFLAAILTGGASAQSNTPQTKQDSIRPVSSNQALYLARSTLLTLNDANHSGNYTVLHDLAAPDFQARNSAADLAQSFADLRRRNFDLFAAALLDPQFSAEPSLDANGKMRLTGFLPTRPLQINFDLTFQSVGGQWRLFAISVATPEAPTKQSQLIRPPSRRSPELLHGFRLFSGNMGLRW